MASTTLAILAAVALAFCPSPSFSLDSTNTTTNTTTTATTTTTTTTTTAPLKNPKMKVENGGDLIVSVAEDSQFGYRHGTGSPVFFPVDGVASVSQIQRLESVLGESPDNVTLRARVAKSLDELETQTATLERISKTGEEISKTSTLSKNVLKSIKDIGESSEGHLEAMSKDFPTLFQAQTDEIVPALKATARLSAMTRIFRYSSNLGVYSWSYPVRGLQSCGMYQTVFASYSTTNPQPMISGMYMIQTPSGKQALVYCEMDLNNGGWTALASNGEDSVECEPCVGGCDTNLGCGVVHPALLSDFTLDVEVQKAITWSKMMVVTYKEGIIKPTGGFGIDFKAPLPTTNRRGGGTPFNVDGFNNRLECTGTPANGYHFKTCRTSKHPTMTKFDHNNARYMSFHNADAQGGWDDFREGCACNQDWGPKSVSGDFAAVFVK